MRGLPKELADIVGAYLVMTQRWLSEDPDEAYRYAYEARRRAARLAVVREACGLTAYAAARWSDALAELRAVRRMRGDDSYLPVIADCERGLGRPERAISMARSPEVAKLPQDMRVEMRIVESGARRDLGQHEAAIVALQGPELRASVPRQFTARLYYAYAEALLAAGRSDEAEEWLARASTADANGETDAAERLAELDELTFLDATGDNAAPADSADFRDNTENAGNPEGTGSTGKDTEASTPGHSSGRQYPG